MTTNKDDLDFQADAAEFENDMVNDAPVAKKRGSRGLLAVLAVLLAGGGAGGYYYMTQMSGGASQETAIPADIPQPDMAAGMAPIDPATGMPLDAAVPVVADTAVAGAVDPVTGLPVEGATPVTAEPVVPDTGVAGTAVIDPAIGAMPADTIPTDTMTVTPEDAGMITPPVDTGIATAPVDTGMQPPVDPALSGQMPVDGLPAEQMPMDQMPMEQIAAPEAVLETAMAPVVAETALAPVVDTAAVDALRAENDALRQQVGDLNTRLSSLEGELSSLRNSVGAAPAGDTANDEDVAELKRSLEKLQREVKKLAEKPAVPVMPTRSYVPSRTSNVDTAVGSVAAPVPAPVMPQPGVSSWTLRSAQPGSAILAGTAGELRTVKVGDVVPGLGRITAIAIGSEGKWVVRGTLAAVNQ